MSGSKCERQIGRYAPPDWHSRNSSMVQAAKTSRDKSVSLRKDAQLLKLETDTRTKWHNYENNIKLSKRVTDIEHWRKQIERALNEVNGEISVLNNAKESCERALEAKALPSDVVTECLSIREARRQSEVVRDPVEASLNNEANLISRIRHLLKDSCEDAWDKLSVLENIRQRLEHDLQDKTDALKIDIDQLELTERSTALSFKPDSTRVPNKSVQPEAWEDHSVQNKADAEREMAKAQHLREAIYHLIEQTNNDLAVQIDQTNFDFRKRMYEMNRSKEELAYQIRKTEEELEQQENTTRDLEIAMAAKDNPLKLAETRLENRKQRPHMELCADSPLEGLVAEVQAIRDSIQLLHDKLENSRETMTDLQEKLKDLKHDHALKSLAFSLDQKCMGVRERLGPAVKTQTDKNLKLTGTLRNTSRFLENSTVTTN